MTLTLADLPAGTQQVNARAHASSVLHDKLIVFGGVRDKVGLLKIPLGSPVVPLLFSPFLVLGSLRK